MQEQSQKKISANGKEIKVGDKGYYTVYGKRYRAVVTAIDSLFLKGVTSAIDVKEDDGGTEGWLYCNDFYIESSDQEDIPMMFSIEEIKEALEDTGLSHTALNYAVTQLKKQKLKYNPEYQKYLELKEKFKDFE